MNDRYVAEIVRSAGGINRQHKWWKYLDEPTYHMKDGVIPTIREALNQPRDEYGRFHYTTAGILDKFGEFGAFLVYGNTPKSFREDDEEKPSEVQYVHYPYIPLYYSRFFYLLSSVKRKIGKFIDVGCGIGDKVVMAHLIFDAKAVGIEYTPRTYHIGKHYIQRFDREWSYYSHKNRLDVELILGDAFDHDFKTYDTIYMYVPIANRDVMYKLYRHIFESMKNGAIVIEAEPSEGFYNAINDHNEESQYLGGCLFKKTRGKIRRYKK